MLATTPTAGKDAALRAIALELRAGTAEIVTANHEDLVAGEDSGLSSGLIDRLRLDVDRVDALTRLNRQRGVAMAMVSHTMSDLLALPTEEDRMKARGFVERFGDHFRDLRLQVDVRTSGAKDQERRFAVHDIG